VPIHAHLRSYLAVHRGGFSNQGEKRDGAATPEALERAPSLFAGQQGPIRKYSGQEYPERD
jgi:hypothetical protein